ncbi:MAG: FtsQ-type POTRA domain-containing protein, partial [Lentisphaerae bacterium]|nr:FtsQ-type POTRA domain-containing protein [Lentisphaerota bacterium]
MWKHRKHRSGGRRTGVKQRRSDRLWVRSRPAMKSKIPWRWVGRALMILLGLLSVLVILGLGALYLERILLRENSLFAIRDCQIECTGEALTPKLIEEYAELSGCTNLFALNIATQRASLLQKVPRVKSVEIARRLPDGLQIKVRERISLARLEMRGYYMTVDREGYVLGSAPSGARHLPVISGHGMPGMRPGSHLAGTPIMNALEVFDVCETTPLRDQFKVIRISVRRPEALELTLEHGVRVALSWQQMGTQSSLSRENLERKRGRLAEILKTAAARDKRVASIDMT